MTAGPNQKISFEDFVKDIDDDIPTDRERALDRAWQWIEASDRLNPEPAMEAVMTSIAYALIAIAEKN